MGREALVSAQLMKQKQKPTETVDQYAQDFETLFDCSYGRRAGMDQKSKDLLKKDLFMLGLPMKLQEKVLLRTSPIAYTRPGQWRSKRGS